MSPDQINHPLFACKILRLFRKCSDSAESTVRDPYDQISVLEHSALEHSDYVFDYGFCIYL